MTCGKSLCVSSVVVFWLVILLVDPFLSADFITFEIIILRGICWLHISSSNVFQANLRDDNSYN